MKKTNIIIATTCCVALTVSSLVYAQRPDASGRLGQGGRPESAQGRGANGGLGGAGGPGGVGGPGMQSAAQVVKMRKELTADERADLNSLRLKMSDMGVDYLRKIQLPSGSFSSSPRVGIGPTIVDAIGLLRAGVKLDEPVLAKALAFLEESVQDDGGIYTTNSHVASYESCLGLVCFHLANEAAGDGRYEYNEANGVDPSDERFGGVGYGAEKSTRPDLSNTQFFVEALREIGVEEEDQAIQDALVFVSRCQNLESEANPAAGQTRGNDGGFFYTFINGEENPAGQEADGGLRSYGSMTYAGLKSLIYAGLTPDDPRVEAAIGWIKEHYTTTQNPGLGKRGLYYYYNTFSKCLKVIGSDSFVDAEGVAHDWRAELLETLALAQNIDGSWVNDDRMWYETDAPLVTGYILTVLSYCAEEEK